MNPIFTILIFTENLPYHFPFIFKFASANHWTPFRFYHGWLYSNRLLTKVQIHCPNSHPISTKIENACTLQILPECTIETNYQITSQINTVSKALVVSIPIVKQQLFSLIQMH